MTLLNGESLWQDILRAGTEVDRARRVAGIDATDEVVAKRSPEFAAAQRERRVASDRWRAFLRGEG